MNDHWLTTDHLPLHITQKWRKLYALVHLKSWSTSPSPPSPSSLVMSKMRGRVRWQYGDSSSDMRERSVYLFHEHNEHVTQSLHFSYFTHHSPPSVHLTSHRIASHLIIFNEKWTNVPHRYRHHFCTTDGNHRSARSSTFSFYNFHSI